MDQRAASRFDKSRSVDPISPLISNLPRGHHRYRPSHSQRRLRLDALAAAEGQVDLLGGAAGGGGVVGGEQAVTLLTQAHLLLHGNHGLLLGPAQGEGHADEQGRDGDGPHGAAGKEGDALNDALGCQVLAQEPGAGGGRDDVAERPQPVGEGLVGGVEVGVVGNLGVCEGAEFSLASVLECHDGWRAVVSWGETAIAPVSGWACLEKF